MTFSSIALKNIRNNYKKYGMYIFATAFNIMVFYMFNAIASNPIVAEHAQSVMQFSVMLKVSSYVIAIFSLNFIWYNIKFFTRQRKNEIGLFSLMGVKRYQIGIMFFVENLVIASISIILGLGLGILFSKLGMMFLLYLSVLNLNVPFSIDPSALINTAIVFYILFLLGTIYSISMVYRFKLSDLFSASKQREAKPNVKVWKTVLAIVTICGGYWLSQNMLNQYLMLNPIIVLVLVVSGTYLLFDTLIVLVLQLAKKTRRRYWKGVNLVSTSNLSHRIRSHSRSLAGIAVLTAVTISASGIAYGFYYNYSIGVEESNPFHIVYTQSLDEEGQQQHKTYKDYIYTHEDLSNVTLDEITVEIANLYIDNAGNDSIIVGRNDSYFTILSESRYNQLSYLKENEKVNLEGNDVLYFHGDYNPQFAMVKEESSISIIGGEDLNLLSINPYGIGQGYSLGQAFVISDELYERLDKEELIIDSAMFYGYRFNDPLDKKSFYLELNEFLPADMYYITYYGNFVNISSTKGVILFTGIFLGLIFLFAKGSMIYFKMISEASNDVVTFDILRKIGLHDRDMMKIIAKQLMVIFLLPLLVGATHAFFAMKSFSLLLGSNSNIMIPMLVVALIYCVVYSFFYLLTVRHYKHICLKRIG